jgi:hypothetical protein
MIHVRPFWTFSLQDLSNGIKNTPRRGVLTPTIELRVFGLPSPIFGSVSGVLTLPSKWGCDSFGGSTVQGRGLALVHGQLLGNLFVEYPRLGLCVVANASLGVVCGRLAP